ncbi:MAG: hypothetical protein LBQ43_02265, partial [Holosporales bacterium]|nr:hypothetical protein [Holosporales bacterium]
MREMRGRMPGKRDFDVPTGGKRVRKHAYDYLWVASLLYLALGFANILFAWLGLICFFIPLLFAVLR